MDPFKSLSKKNKERLVELEKHFPSEVVLHARIQAKESCLLSEQMMFYQRYGEFDNSEVIGGEDHLGINRELRELRALEAH